MARSHGIDSAELDEFILVYYPVERTDELPLVGQQLQASSLLTPID